MRKLLFVLAAILAIFLMAPNLWAATGDKIIEGHEPAALTKDAEWDTEGEVETKWGSVNIILATEIDTEGELETIMGSINIIVSTEIDTYDELNTLVANVTLYASDQTDVAVADGGTAKSSWTQYAIPYLSDTTTFGEIAIGTALQFLRVNASENGYEFVAAPAGFFGAAVEKTIATGVVDLSDGTRIAALAGEGAAADDLTEIQAQEAGHIVVLTGQDVAYDITIKNGDYMKLEAAADFTINNQYDSLLAFCRTAGVNDIFQEIDRASCGD